MQLITFTCDQNYEGQPKFTTMKSTDAEQIEDVLESFQDFLRGCGFQFDGSVQIGEEL